MYAEELQDAMPLTNGLPRCSKSGEELYRVVRGRKESPEEEMMLAAIAAVLLVLWLLAFIAFHVTFGAIHLLLVIAVVLFVAHFLTGRSAAV